MNSFRKNLLSIAIVSGLGIAAGPAAAGLVPLGSWGLDLTALNGLSAGGTTYTGFGNFSDFLATPNAPPETGNLQDLTVNGSSSVTQNLSGGSAVGQTFVEEGFLNWNGASNANGTPVGNTAFAEQLGTNDVTGENYIYFEWSGLTGTAINNQGEIVFDTGAAQLGTITLYLDDDAPSLSGIPNADSTSIVLATFNLVPLSGGSNIGIDGGAFPSGTVGLTLDPTSNPYIVFLDALGNSINNDVLFQFIDIDATLSQPATFYNAGGNVVVNPAEAAYFISEPIAHNGSLVPAVDVPEPGTLALMGIALVAFGGTARRMGRQQQA